MLPTPKPSLDRETLDKINVNLESRDLRALRRQYAQAADPQATQPALPTKAEAYIHLAKLIEGMWQEVADQIRRYPEVHGLLRYDHSKQQVRPYTREELERRCDESRGSIIEKRLRDDTRYQMDRCFGSRIATLFEGLTAGSDDPLLEPFRRYGELHAQRRGGFNLDIARRHIVAAGAGTANGIMWTACIVPPAAFSRDIGRLPTLEECSDLCRKAMNRSHRLAFLMGDDFDSLRGTILPECPDASIMRVTEGAHGFDIDYVPDLLEHLVNYPRKPFGREEKEVLGCPAAATEGAFGGSVIHDLKSWIRAIAVDLYYPRRLARMAEGSGRYGGDYRESHYF